MLIAAPAAHASPFCDALQTAAAGAAAGFVTVRGPALVTARTQSLDVFQARVALPGAAGCSVNVPRGAGRAPAVYACAFPGGVDVKRAMGRLVRRSARCAKVDVGNPPRLKNGADGPSFYFASGVARFDLSAVRAQGKSGLWTVTLAISKGPAQPRRPFA
jgi:hypothetical protein